jgi:hypothetical protein
MQNFRQNKNYLYIFQNFSTLLLFRYWGKWLLVGIADAFPNMVTENVIFFFYNAQRYLKK